MYNIKYNYIMLKNICKLYLHMEKGAWYISGHQSSGCAQLLVPISTKFEEMLTQPLLGGWTLPINLKHRCNTTQQPIC